MAGEAVDRIKTDLRQAQLSRDDLKVSTLRLLLSEINNTRIALRQSSGQAKQAELTGQEIISVIQREIKKRREAAEGFRSGGRSDQADKEEKEAQVLQDYLPEQLSNEELTKIVEDTIKELGIVSTADMGRVIGVVMGKTAGQAAGSIVSKIVKEKLTNQ